MPRHLVFLTRKFPPSVGGMETLSAGVWRSLVAARPNAVKISHGGPNRDLAWWLPVSLARLLVQMARRQVDLVVTGDAVMYVAASGLLRIFRVPNATLIHGLDVTYENRAYQAVVHPLLRRAPRLIAVSSATAQRAREIGVPAERISILRLGVQAPDMDAGARSAASIALRRRHHFAESDVLVLTLGRLVRRKGVRWFVAEVLPALPEQVHYLIVGDGDDKEKILAAANRAGVEDRVHLLGRVDDADCEELLRGADLFVQPNIPVPGDMEGFGLVTIEAAMRGTPVVAADLEGIRDAVIDGSTGILLPPQDPKAWIERLRSLLGEKQTLEQLGSDFQVAVRHLYGEAAMARALAQQLGLDATSR